jgi:hypothetical protein
MALSLTRRTDFGQVDRLIQHKVKDIGNVVVALHEQLGLAIDHLQPATRKYLEQLSQYHSGPQIDRQSIDQWAAAANVVVDPSLQNLTQHGRFG